MSSTNSSASDYSILSTSITGEIEEDLREGTQYGLKVGQDDRNVDMETGDGDDLGSDVEAYFDEPMADEAWLQEYRRQREEDNERLRELQLRWNGSKPVPTW